MTDPVADFSTPKVVRLTAPRKPHLKIRWFDSHGCRWDSDIAFTAEWDNGHQTACVYTPDGGYHVLGLTEPYVTLDQFDRYD